MIHDRASLAKAIEAGAAEMFERASLIHGIARSIEQVATEVGRADPEDERIVALAQAMTKMDENGLVVLTEKLATTALLLSEIMETDSSDLAGAKCLEDPNMLKMTKSLADAFRGRVPDTMKPTDAADFPDVDFGRRADSSAIPDKLLRDLRERYLGDE